MTTVRLHVNVDHVATLRQARGTDYPDPVRAAALAERAGAAGITVHLREDRRHVQDRDVTALRSSVTTLLNLEMAVTEEMIGIATRVRPDLVTLVPEKREERTTEGGLDVVGARSAVADAVRRLGETGIPVSLFIDPEEAQIRASIDVGAASIELHTGDYANARGEDAADRELARLADASATAGRLSAKLRVAAGHGLTLENTAALVARMPEVEELNIGHALVSDAVFLGMEGAVEAYLRVVEEGRRGRA